MGEKYKWLEMCQKRDTMIRDSVKEIRLNIFAESGYESPTTTAMLTPEDVKGTEVYNAMRGRGSELTKGYGDVKEITFEMDIWDI